MSTLPHYLTKIEQQISTLLTHFTTISYGAFEQASHTTVFTARRYA